MEAEVEGVLQHEDTRAGAGQSGSNRDSRAFLRGTAQHLATLLETTEAQLEILTRELLPPLKGNTDLQDNFDDFPSKADTERHNSLAATTGERVCAAAAEPPSSSGPQQSSDSSISSHSDTGTSSVPFTSHHSLHPPSAPTTVASSVLENRNAGFSATFLETNLLLAREYHQACCSLSRMLHHEIENLDLIPEGVCGNRVYNAVMQVENLQMLKEERKNLALLRKALSEH